MAGSNLVQQHHLPQASEEQWVRRFGATERFVHWWTVSMVAVALLTGLAMGDEAESGALLTVHWGAVVLIGVGLLGAFVVGDTWALAGAIRRLFIFDRRDVIWVRDHLRPPSARARQGDYGMSNPARRCWRGH